MDLKELAIKHKTDKWGSHYYTPHYERHLEKFKNEPITMLEIGIGGYGDPYDGGNSIRVWSEWFTHPEATIIGIDINDKLMPFEDPRVKIHKGSQVDSEFLDGLHQQYGSFDIVIDDGSHLPEHVIETFELLYPRTKNGGIYVVEDTQTSYWNSECWGALSTYNPENPTYSYFKRLPDWINYAEIPIATKPNFFEMNTVGAHFYHNMIFIDKLLNTEKSNIIPSRLEGKKAASYPRLPIIFQAKADAGLKLKLIAHIGAMGDVENNEIPTIITDGIDPHFIQGFKLVAESEEVSSAIEYKACLDSGEWTDWVACNHYVGTRGESRNLTGLSVRMNEGLSAQYTLKVVGAFKHDHGVVIVGDGEPCISPSANSQLSGIQVILEKKS